MPKLVLVLWDGDHYGRAEVDIGPDHMSIKAEEFTKRVLRGALAAARADLKLKRPAPPGE
jgi:hypothetical protein